MLQVIRRSLERLGHLSDRVERVTSRLQYIVSSSHTILDCPFLSQQVDNITNTTDSPNISIRDAKKIIMKKFWFCSCQRLYQKKMATLRIFIVCLMF